MAGLLFIAFAYFAVAQAADTRSGTQTAADSAALAASQDARDQLRGKLLGSLLDPDSWEDLVNGDGVEFDSACAEARSFAGRNGADVADDGCRRSDGGFTVTVRSRGTVGDSVVPGTENRHARATATAVIEPRCRVKSGDSRDPGPDRGKEKDGKKGEADDEAGPPLELECDDQDWIIDPDNQDILPDAADLFSVHLQD